MRANILSATWSDVTPGAEAEFRQWYQTRHMPEHVACPGLRRGARYERTDGGLRYLAVYDIESAEALTTPQIRAAGAEGWGPVLHRLTGVVSRRYEHGASAEAAGRPREPQPAGYLAVVQIETRPAVDGAAFRRWLDDEVAPQTVSADGVRGLTRYEPADGGAVQLLLVESDEPVRPGLVRMGDRMADLRTYVGACYRLIYTVGS